MALPIIVAPFARTCSWANSCFVGRHKRPDVVEVGNRFRSHVEDRSWVVGI